MESLWVVCYNITDIKRLRRVERICSDFGYRAQDSVFACSISAKQLDTLQKRLLRVMSIADDTVRYYPLCKRDQNSMVSHGHDLLGSDAVQSWIV
jgi:CRISPR-associated protein Cas2